MIIWKQEIGGIEQETRMLFRVIGLLFLDRKTGPDLSYGSRTQKRYLSYA